MYFFLKKGHFGIISQFHAIEVLQNTTVVIHSDMQRVLDQYQYLFEIPKGLPPSQGDHVHNIHLIPSRNKPMYALINNLFAQNEINKII